MRGICRGSTLDEVHFSICSPGNMPPSLAFKVMTLANHVKVKHPAAPLVPKDNSKTSPPKVT
ncbi:hypothetical protein RHMOL_Rhmol03G0030900 [Rhododendron molle]|uniref:Uncharacterized protein n=1 Tax=Rhododendron molle TaxID=49168 RepID=A0ACC0PBG8_RHOML|nr:hypothetical protein RHMOL_Rhmol03G0030900 [Rhododendron molle]